MGCHPNERRFAIGRDTGIGVCLSCGRVRWLLKVGPEIEQLLFEIWMLSRTGDPNTRVEGAD